MMRKRPELAAEMQSRYREASKRIEDISPRGGIPRKNKRRTRALVRSGARCLGDVEGEVDEDLD
jgi:hypothetical protein